MTLINPYKNINFAIAERVQGNTHNHLFYQWHVDNMYANGGRFIGAHPHYGKPLYPLSDYGLTIPGDAIEYALSEVYGTTDYQHPMHFSAVGSTLVTDETEPHSGFEGTMREFLDEVRNTLQVPDGGGIHWNHPGFTFPTDNNPTLEKIKQAYDYAPDIFLGVEFYNNSQGKTYPDKQPLTTGWWDALLKSGRHVWGFANPDYEARRLDPYPDWEGKQIYLVNEFSREAILRAIRNGHFYNVLQNTDLHFIGISDTNNTVSVSLTKPANIKFKTATREVVVNGVSQASLTIANTDVYVRIEASEGVNTIFSQAIMYDGVIVEPIKKPLIKNRSILI